MMNRIHEVNKFQSLVIPQSMSAGTTVTGAYKSLIGSGHDVLFLILVGVLAATKTVTVKVFQADDVGATNEEELADAETVFTSPSGGVTEGQILVSIPLNHFSREFATVKIVNTAAAPVLGFAEMITDQAVRGSSANSQANVITVV
jgi:hypothetical protein